MLRIETDAFEAADLVGLLPASIVPVAEERSADAHGEPVTIVVLVLMPLAIRTLAIWLSKKRRREVFEVEVEAIEPSGKVTRARLRWDRRSSDSGPENLIQHIGDALKLDDTLIRSALEAQ
jgi:hypothetical protein